MYSYGTMPMFSPIKYIFFHVSASSREHHPIHSVDEVSSDHEISISSGAVYMENPLKFTLKVFQGPKR